MKLKDYLTETKHTTAEFADKIGADRTAVHRWLQGKTHPRPKMAALIVKITKNAVTFEDLYA